MTEDLELTILMPCLNEIETLSTCINKALTFLKENNISGEVLISDNGSTDGSIETAIECGARVTHAPLKGYGAALINGIENAKGRYIIMGDSDDSYDFSRLELYVEKLREGHDLVMGNRFKGGIEKGAMPFLHYYLGNPVLSFIGRIFFNIPVGDFHCGLRGFNRESIQALKLKTTGMEFASEMVVRSALSELKIAEVPTTLSIDGRTRPPHLNTWRDGWRHLRFLLIFSPRWLFLYSGLLSMGIGAILIAALLPGPVALTPNIVLDTHSFFIGCLAFLIGAQGVSFAVIARRFAAMLSFLPQQYRMQSFLDSLSLEKILLGSAGFFILGIIGIFYCIGVWWSVDFGPLEYKNLIKVLMISGTAVAFGLQSAFCAFLIEVFKTGIQPRS